MLTFLHCVRAMFRWRQPLPWLYGAVPAALVLLATGCSMPKMPDIPTLTPYKMDIQQGNVVTQEMISKLQPGMTRSQVRFALGTPLVVDPFRDNRWDYVYRYDKRGQQVEHRRIVVIFDGDKLVRIEGDVVPGTGTTAGSAKADKPAPPAAGAGKTKEEKAKEEAPNEQKPQEERGFFGRMLDRLGF